MAEEEHETLTYREIAERLGLSLDAAKSLGKRRAKSGRWQRWTGNDGTARLRVPVSDLVRPEGGPGSNPGGEPRVDPGSDRAGWEAYREAVTREINTLHATLDTLRADLDRERQRSDRLAEEVDREREARKQAESEADKVRRERDEAIKERDLAGEAHEAAKKQRKKALDDLREEQSRSLLDRLLRRSR